MPARFVPSTPLTATVTSVFDAPFAFSVAVPLTPDSFEVSSVMVVSVAVAVEVAAAVAVEAAVAVSVAVAAVSTISPQETRVARSRAARR